MIKEVHLFYLLGISVIILGLTGCAGRATYTGVRRGLASPRTPIASVEEYRLEPGDVIEVKLFYNPNLNETVSIRPDGKISLQLLDDVQAAGFTPSELDEVLTTRYGDVVREPELTVIVRTFSGQRVYVGGEVRSPKLVEIGSRLTLLQAVFEAGGLRETANPHNIMVIQRGKTGRPEVLRVDLEEALSGEDVYLKPYDVVYVPESAVAKADRFVDQYINKLTPIFVIRGFEYLLYLNR